MNFLIVFFGSKCDQVCCKIVVNDFVVNVELCCSSMLFLIVFFGSTTKKSIVDQQHYRRAIIACVKDLVLNLFALRLVPQATSRLSVKVGVRIGELKATASMRGAPWFVGYFLGLIRFGG